MRENSLDAPVVHDVAQGTTSSASIGIIFLAIAAGSLDVISFLTLDHVFASAMTGNTALLGIAISGGDWSSAARPAIALCGFIIGTATASVASHSSAARERRLAALKKLLLLEAACLVTFAIVQQLDREMTPHVAQYLLILLCSFGMGLQVIAAKTVGAPEVNTIVFTSTVAAAVSSYVDIVLGRQTGARVRNDTLRQILSFAAYAAGALIAGLLAWSKFSLLAWLPVAAVLLALSCFRNRLLD